MMDSIVGKFGIDEANQTTHHFDPIDDIYLENAIDHAAITLEPQAMTSGVEEGMNEKLQKKT